MAIIGNAKREGSSPSGKRRERTAWIQCAVAAWILALAMPLPARATDDDGVLPQGDPLTLDQDKVTTPPKAGVARPFDCLEILATPRGMPAEFINSGRELLWLARMSESPQGPSGPRLQGGSQGPHRNAPRTVLYRLDVSHRHATPVLALDLDEPLATIQRPGAVTLLSFEPSPKARCYEGPAQMVDVSFVRSKGRAVIEHGNYAILGSPLGRRLFDLDKRAVVEIDPQTSQKRYGRKIPEDERPLSIDPEADLVVSLLPEKKGQREVVAYQESRQKPLDRWAAPVSDRLLEARYGAILSLKTNILRNEVTLVDLTQRPDGETKDKGVYKFRLPKGYGVSVAQVEYDERAGLAIVTGATPPAKETWKKVFVFDSRSGRLVASVRAGAKAYVHLTALSPQGDKLFAELRSIKSKETTGARLLDIKTGKDEAVHLVPLTSPPPSGP